MALAQARAAETPFSKGYEQLDELVACLESAEARKMNHSELERELAQRGREIMRLMLQGYLETRARDEACGPVRDAQNVEHTGKRQHTRKLETEFGTVSVERVGYGGPTGVESLHPLDAALNLPKERYSHELRRRAAEEAAKTSFDEVVESLKRNTGARIAKRQVEQLVIRAAQDFDAFYAGRQAGTDSSAHSGSILVLTFDGKGVVMRKQDLREATRKAAERRRHKCASRLSKGEKRNAKRMSTVASVYTLAPYVRTAEQVARTLAPVHEAVSGRRPRPEKKRVWASLEKSPKEVMEDAFQEASRRDPNREKIWIAQVDGNPTQIEILQELAGTHGIDLTIVLDLIHVAEYLWKAGRAFRAEGTPDLESWVRERFLKVLQGKGCEVASEIVARSIERELDSKQRELVDCCAQYLLKHKDYLAYDRYLEKGLPIATGVIEGACRHLIKDRMDLTGARWSLKGAEAVLRLRALRSSRDFDEYWAFHEKQEHQRHHVARYFRGEVPTLREPQTIHGKPALTVIK
jgi:hypothetical protein